MAEILRAECSVEKTLGTPERVTKQRREAQHGQGLHELVPLVSRHF